MAKKPLPEFVEFLLDRLAPIGPVSARAMFGGYGIYCDHLMFGLVADDELYLKVDALSKPEFEAEGLAAFQFNMKNGKSGTMSYHHTPEMALDDNDIMLTWANKGLAAAMRNKK